MSRKTLAVLGLVLALAVFVYLTTIALHWVSYDLRYFERRFVLYGIPQDLDVELDELMGFATLLTDYLRGSNDDPNVVTLVRGRYGPLYGEREVEHLRDVRDLFDLSRSVQRAALVVALAALFSASWRRSLPDLFRLTLKSGLGLVALLLLLALLVATDFERYFIIFHEISFSNDLWILDPQTEFLIRMFPEPFFAGMAARIAMALAAMYGFFLASIHAYLRREERRLTAPETSPTISCGGRQNDK